MASYMGPDTFTAQFTGGGYRTNLYGAVMPTDMMSDKASYLCKAASAPPSNFGMPDVSYMGRKIKLVGDREYPDWETTFYEDQVDPIRQKIIKWQEDFQNKAIDNTQASGQLNSYARDITFMMLKRDGNPVSGGTYIFKSCWPVTIGEISVGYDQNDTVGEFSVTWSYQYWTQA